MKHDIDKLLQDHINNNELVQAALLVRQDGNVVYDGIFGYEKLETKQPVRRNSIFRLMSMSKVITAVCILQLYEQGLLGR